MDFIVEDGTGVSDATSYTTVEFSDEYLGSDWATDVETKENALIVATEYVDARWGTKFRGVPLTTTQSLEFPRTNICDRYGNEIEGVPTDLQKATSQYAKSSLTQSLYPSNSTGNSKEVIKKKTVVGPITTEVEYQGVKPSNSPLSFSLPDKFCKQYIYSYSGVIR